MTTPTLLVEARWGAADSTRFVIGDATKGVIGGTYTIAPAEGEWVDITTVNMGLTSKRGVDSELDQSQAGSLNFTIEDTARLFDPSNTSSPYYDRVRWPGAEVRYSLNGVQRWQGRTDDQDVNYDGEPTTTHIPVTASGPFAVLSNANVASTTSGGNNDRAGRRMRRLLDHREVRWPPSMRTIDEGDGTFGPTTFGQDALSYAYRVARDEDGMFFEGRDGTIVFRGRHYNYGSSKLTFTDAETDLLNARSDFATYPFIPYSNPVQRTSTDLLYDRITGSAVGGVREFEEEELHDDRPFTRPPRSFELGETLYDDEFKVRTLERRLLRRYAEPQVRFSSVTVDLLFLTADQTAAVLALDIGDRVTMVRTPPGGGSPISLVSQVIGVADAPDGMSCPITFSLGTAQPEPTFIIGDSDMAVIGTTKIG